MTAGDITAQTASVGWIGTGVMGRSMCSRILEAGYSVTLHTRTRDKAGDLLARGATWAESPREVARRSRVCFSIVGYPQEVEQVFLGDRGLLAGAAPGSLLVDMATSPPPLSQRIAAQGEAAGVLTLDAPVSGGDVGARQGTLSIMVGGDRAAFDALEPLWSILGATAVHQGGPGAGQQTKLTNQIVIATNMIGVCEGLLFAHRAGLNLDTVMASIENGAAGSWSLSNLGKRIMQDNFDPGFFVDHFIKDMGLALDEARRMNLELPGLSLARELYERTREQGHGAKGTHALQLALASMSGIDWTRRNLNS